MEICVLFSENSSFHPNSKMFQYQKTDVCLMFQIFLLGLGTDVEPHSQTQCMWPLGRTCSSCSKEQSPGGFTRWRCWALSHPWVLWPLTCHFRRCIRDYGNTYFDIFLKIKQFCLNIFLSLIMPYCLSRLQPRGQLFWFSGYIYSRLVFAVLCSSNVFLVCSMHHTDLSLQPAQVPRSHSSWYVVFRQPELPFRGMFLMPMVWCINIHAYIYKYTYTCE